MKVSMEELRGAIRMIMREEVAKLLPEMLPGLIAEALAEKYLKKVMAEVSRPAAKDVRPTNLHELMQGDEESSWEEEVPTEMSNDHRGIYHQNPMVRGKGGHKVSESVRRQQLADIYGEDPETALKDPRDKVVERISGGNPELAAMFEGTVPTIPDQRSGSSVKGETQQVFGDEGVPLDMLGKLGVNFGNIRKNVEGSSSETSREKIDEGRLKQLELRRQSLERRVV